MIIEVNESEFSGTLISDRTVLTACHLRSRIINALVKAGQWDRASEDAIIPYQVRRVKQGICDPQYDIETVTNNVALLTLDKPFDLMPHIRPVCLPSTESLNYTACIVSGWNKLGAFGRRTLMRAAATFDCEIDDRNSRTKKCANIDANILTHSIGSGLVCPRANGKSGPYYLAGIWLYGTRKNETWFSTIADSYNRILTQITKNAN